MTTANQQRQPITATEPERNTCKNCNAPIWKDPAGNWRHKSWASACTFANQTYAEPATAPQYFTPQLHRNMQALMQGDSTRQQIAKHIALVFVDCENIAEFTAPHCPSPRHAAAWVKSLLDHAKTLRILTARAEEEEARRSVTDQIAYERRARYYATEEAEAEQDRHAAALQGDRQHTDAELRAEELLSPEERATLAAAASRMTSIGNVPEGIKAAVDRFNANQIAANTAALAAAFAAMPDRRSSVDVFGDDEEVGNAILAAAIDHLYRSPNYQLHNRTIGDCLAIDCMSGLRDMDWGDLSEVKQFERLSAAAASFAPRRSSVDGAFYQDSRGEAEAAELVLRNAADYLYNRQNGATWEHADPGDAAAVDALDDYRTVIANGNDLARITDEVGNVDLCEVSPVTTRVVRILERIKTAAPDPEEDTTDCQPRDEDYK